MSQFAAGVDLGSSAVKVVLFEFAANSSPQPVEMWTRSIELQAPAPGRVEQDPEPLLAAAAEGIAAITAVRGPIPVGFSSAMHSLLCLGDDGEPLARAITWADQRATPEARELRAADPDMQRRTGTPLHSMAWPAKLLWLRRQEPELFTAAARFTDLKTYVLSRLAGRAAPMDLSTASGTGLLNLTDRTWDAAALHRLGVSDKRLPQLGSPTDTLAVDLCGQVVVGGGDGPLSNLGTGSLEPGTAALSVGTSGAVRVARRGPAQTDGRLFCYHLAADRWVVGGAVSNASLAMQWLRDLAASAGAGGLTVKQIVAAAQEAPAGADGLVVLPYLAGERAPHWDARARAVITGLGLHHRWNHLARAFLEGIAMALREVLELCEESTGPIARVRATGGLTLSDGFVQILADVLGRPVQTMAIEQAGALGAALLALASREGLEAVLERATRVQCRAAVKPDGETRELYARLFARYRELYPVGLPETRRPQEGAS